MVYLQLTSFHVMYGTKEKQDGTPVFFFFLSFFGTKMATDIRIIFQWIELKLTTFLI